MHELISKCQKSLITVDKYYDAALQHVRGELIVNGKLSRDNLDREQHAAHGLSWVAAYRATLKEMVNWASNLDSTGTFNETEQLILQITFSTAESLLRMQCATHESPTCSVSRMV